MELLKNKPLQVGNYGRRFNCATVDPQQRVPPCKMEDTFLEIVQPAHLKPFVPLAA